MSTKGKLIVLAAFNKSEEGDLVQAFDPRQVDFEDRAKREGRLIANQYAGVVAWSREENPAIGEYGCRWSSFSRAMCQSWNDAPVDGDKILAKEHSEPSFD